MKTTMAIVTMALLAMLAAIGASGQTSVGGISVGGGGAYATKAQGVKADSALQAVPALQQVMNAGNTATNVGALSMGTNKISGARFGTGAGDGAGGNDWFASGYFAGNNALGDNWHANGPGAGTSAYGDDWYVSGDGAGVDAIHTNSHVFGRYAGRTARGNTRMYLDVYAADPSYAANGATNDTIFMDSDGKLYLGGGPSRAENPLAGGVLRGTWTISGLSIYAYCTNLQTRLSVYESVVGVKTQIFSGAGVDHPFTNILNAAGVIISATP